MVFVTTTFFFLDQQKVRARHVYLFSVFFLKKQQQQHAEEAEIKHEAVTYPEPTIGLHAIFVCLFLAHF